MIRLANLIFEKVQNDHSLIVLGVLCFLAVVATAIFVYLGMIMDISSKQKDYNSF